MGDARGLLEQGPGTSVGCPVYAPQVFKPHHRTSTGHAVCRRRCLGHSSIARGSADAPFVALQSVGFGVPLGQLQADNCPKYLARCLGFALKEAQVHSLGSETQIEGVQALLEVFDKVCQKRTSAYGPLTQYRFWGTVPSIASSPSGLGNFAARMHSSPFHIPSPATESI